MDLDHTLGKHFGLKIVNLLQPLFQNTERRIDMSEHLKNIEIYGMTVSDFDINAFESIDILHQRRVWNKFLTSLI